MWLRFNSALDEDHFDIANEMFCTTVKSALEELRWKIQQQRLKKFVPSEIRTWWDTKTILRKGFIQDQIMKVWKRCCQSKEYRKEFDENAYEEKSNTQNPANYKKTYVQNWISLKSSQVGKKGRKLHIATTHMHDSWIGNFVEPKSQFLYGPDK